MSEIDQLKQTIQRSSELSKRGKHDEALALLDSALRSAVLENRTTWIRTLSSHAAVISDSVGDLHRVRRYYEQSLASDPDNYRSLYGLANALQRLGETRLARQYAAKCYRAIRGSENELDSALQDLLLEGWPELAVHDTEAEP